MLYRLQRPLVILACAFALTGCVRTSSKIPVAEGELGLSSIVLYRNGVGYFERRGEVVGDRLRLRVRRDHLNDLLKSLTVVDSGGRVLSISMPLEGGAWAEVAGSALGDSGSRLADALASLEGTRVRLTTDEGSARGRISMVEAVDLSTAGVDDGEFGPREDHRITLLDEQKLSVVWLSKVSAIELEDGNVAMSLHRSLDASSGEGMFQLVDVDLQLTAGDTRQVLVSYVVEAPVWKPTYRVVLPEDAKNQALLQGFAVVDNISGEDWSGVDLSLAAGAPIAFQYDMHSPQIVERRNMNHAGQRRRAEVALGDTRTFEAEVTSEASMAQSEPGMYDDEADENIIREESKEMAIDADMRRDEDGRARSRKKNQMVRPPSASLGGMGGAQPMSPPAVSMSLDEIAASSGGATKTARIAGLTRIDLDEKVSVPRGTSTMLAFINEQVEAEDAFLYKRGGAGRGYENNPYRVLRFVNRTAFALEPGPVSIYARGSFVGEGFSDAIGSGSAATIPYAVEQGIEVESRHESEQAPMRVVRVSGGVLEVEQFSRRKTTWQLRSAPQQKRSTVYVEHTRAGQRFELVSPPADTQGLEQFPEYYRVPIVLDAGKATAELAVVEETPSRFSLSVWDGRAEALLDTLLASASLDAEARAQLQPVVERRRKIGRIDTEIRGLEQQQRTISARADAARRNLQALKKDPKASSLRQRIGKRLESFSNEADELGRKIVSLRSRRLEEKLELEELLQNLDLRLPSKQ